MNSLYFSFIKASFRALRNEDRKDLLFMILLLLASCASDFLLLFKATPRLATLNTSSLTAGDFSDILQFGLLIVLNAVLKSTAIKFSGLLSASIGTRLATLYLSKTINNDYERLKSHRSSQTITALIKSMDNTIKVVYSLNNLVIGLSSAAAVLLAMVFTSMIPSLCVLLSILFCYLGLGYAFRRRLSEISTKSLAYANQETKCLQEIFGCRKDILVNDSVHDYVEAFSLVDTPLRKLQANARYLGVLPRYLLESAGVVFMMCAVGFILMTDQGASTKIEQILVIAFGTQRLIPSFQIVYSYWSEYKSSRAEIKGIMSIIGAKSSPLKAPLVVSACKSIRLENVSFKYGSSRSYVLQDVNLEIHEGDKVLISGRSGQGKSTLLDIIMNLLCPTVGFVSYGKCFLGGSLRSSRNSLSIGHVSQNIALPDETICQVVANKMLVTAEDRVKVADILTRLSLEHLSSDVALDCKIGESQSLLSGGQAQRLCIARALFEDKRLYVFDEITSALDKSTEKRVVRSIIDYLGGKTVVFVSHRLDSFDDVDKRYLVENGRVKLLPNWLPDASPGLVTKQG